MELKETYTANSHRYDDSEALYKRCGKSGILLPKISLGFWHNFGGVDPYERSRAITHYAFDHGITHFDLANKLRSSLRQCRGYFWPPDGR